MNPEPLSSKRFLAFLIGMMIAFMLGTRRTTHIFYLGVITFILYFGRHPVILGATNGFVIFSVAAILLAGFLGAGVNEAITGK